MAKKIIPYYMHSDKESNWDYADELGLSDVAQDKFRYTGYEVKFDLEVDTETGQAYAVAFEGQALTTPVKMN